MAMVNVLTLKIGDALMINEKYANGVTSPEAWLVDSIEHDGRDSFLRATNSKDATRCINVWKVAEDTNAISN